MSRPLSPSDVTAVVVTYGERQALLAQVLETLRREAVGQVVVVDNGAKWDITPWGRHYGDWLITVRMGRNSGSAGGFATGIQAATSTAARMIWLLDDDNVPAPMCLQSLLSEYEARRHQGDASHLAMLAFRPEHQSDLLKGQAVNARSSSFQGLHVADAPARILRWLRPRGARPAPVLPECVRLDVAPYSGLLLERDVIAAIGLPLPELVLYGDDTEYSFRITASGGRIVLVTKARITDLETSWNVRAEGANAFETLLLQGSDFRAYYGVRNRSWFDGRRLMRSRLVFALNVGLYLAFLSIYAAKTGRLARYRLVCRAIRDGLAARLGIHPSFPPP